MHRYSTTKILSPLPSVSDLVAILEIQWLSSDSGDDNNASFNSIVAHCLPSLPKTISKDERAKLHCVKDLKRKYSKSPNIVLYNCS